MNRHLELLLSDAYAGALAPAHLADLRKSGITYELARAQKICSVPPHLIAPLLGFAVSADVESALLFPFPDPRGGFMDYVKVKTFPDHVDRRGDAVVSERREPRRSRYNAGRRKYLVRRRAAARLYFPIPTMQRALQGEAPVWICEGMKKTLSAAQLGLPAVGIESCWSWHRKGSWELLADFDFIPLAGRIVELAPDSDVGTNPAIGQAMRRLADALYVRGARPRLVRVPALNGASKTGLDDYVMQLAGAGA